MADSLSEARRLAAYRGLRAHLRGAVLGQEEAVDALCGALLAGELGHGSPGRPRSLLLLLGPTGTGKTRSVAEASRHLFGTGAMAKVNAAEYSAPERVPLLLGARSGEAGHLGEAIARMRDRGGRILLIDEIEKAHRSVADYLLGIEEASLTVASGETLDLSGIHVVATSNVGSSGVVGLEGLSRASVRRFVEQEASEQFRPEVLARFTALIVFGHLGRDTQLAVCGQMLEDELALQARALSRMYGHPVALTAGPGVCSRLAGEGWHRRLGARPMRNTVERRVRGALVEARLNRVLGPGVTEAVLVTEPGGGLRAAVARLPMKL
jgi:ATP-dependent Clp protease ATP-binding subunit ClpB